MEYIRLNVMSIITIAGIAQGFFLLSALFKTERGERLINRMFLCLLSVFTLDILLSSIVSIKISTSFPFIIGIHQCVRFLYGPIFLMYTQVLYEHEFSFNRKIIKHLIPFAVSLIFIVILSILPQKVFFEQCTRIMHINLQGLIDMMKVLLSLAVFIQSSAYLIYCYHSIPKSNSETSRRNEFLTHKILFFLCSLYTILCFSSHITEILISGLSFLSHISPLFITTIIFLFGYAIICKPELLFVTWEKDTHHSVYKKINLSEEKTKEYLNRLYSVMEQEKLYKDQDLTLSLLADRIYLSRNLLSYLLNNVIGTNFYDFINGFRVEAVKTLLTDSATEHENILNIAFDAGFNSKSAFNKIFKKQTNMSPSEYRKEMIKGRKEKQILSRMMKLNLIEELEHSYNIKSVARTS